MVSINWNDTRCFKTWNYNFVHKDVGNLIVEAVAVLMGDYEIYRKQAAMLLLKVLLRKDFLKCHAKAHTPDSLGNFILSKAKKVKVC